MPVRAVTFRLSSSLPSEAVFLLRDFRLAVNAAVRAGIRARVTSRNALGKLAYREFREEHPMVYAQHLVSSFEVAASVLKNHRRREHRGTPRIPYVKRLMMKAENQAYRLDRANAVVDLPIRAGCHVQLKLVVSQYHRRYLDDESLSLGSLTLLQDRVIIAFRKETVKVYAPELVLSLDTNERSLDGVFAKGGFASPLRAELDEVAAIQQRHHDRRKRLQRRKAHDRRTSRRLCGREGKRERDRIQYRLHKVADSVLSFAETERSAILLEDLRGIKNKKTKDKNLSRRLSMWPRRKLHQIIKYKAEWRGIPVVMVDPRFSSRKCPICGRMQYSRMGTEFKCECGWHLDRHINASLNLLQTAFSKGLEVAGGLRFDPDAFQHDVMMILYSPEGGARSEPNGTSCRGEVAS